MPESGCIVSQNGSLMWRCYLCILEKMADITGVIGGIASWTNILALNAAAEVDRAGSREQDLPLSQPKLEGLLIVQSPQQKKSKS